MQLFSRSTFQGKLLILFVLFSILPLTLVALIVYQTVRERYEAVLQISFQESVILQEKLIERYFESNTSLLRSLAAQDILLAEVERASQGEGFAGHDVFVTLSSLRRENPFIEKLYILDAEGEVLASTATDEAGRSFRTEAFFVEPLESRLPYIGEVRVSTFGKRVIPLATPLVRKSDNRVIGILAMEINSSAIGSVIRSEEVRPAVASDDTQFSARSYVVDADGYLLTRLSDAGFTDRIDPQPVLRCRNQGLDSEGIWESYNGKRVLGVARCLSIGDLSWTLVVEQDSDEAFAVSRQLGLMILFITFGIGLVLIFVIVAVSNSIADPIRILRRGTRELGQGNFGYRISIKTGDEFEELADDFEETRKHLRLARERESHLARMKSEFISIAAHQLRTPLTGIKWSLEEFFKDEKDAKREEHGDLKRALSSVYAMIRLVNDLLDVTRIEEGRFEYHFKPGNVVALVQRIVREVGPRAASHVVELKLNEPTEPVPEFAFDEEKLRMVFINVLDNALKYTPAGGSVTIDYEVKAHEVHIAVRDTGIGIPPDQLGNIFTKFFRAENAIHMHTSGSGLGLFVTQQIVKAHGGSVWVTSEENKGTVVHITLPYDDSRRRKGKGLGE